MKSLLIIILTGICFSAFSQKDESITILQKLFLVQLNSNGKITQEKDGMIRELVPYEIKTKATFKKYQLTEKKR